MKHAEERQVRPFAAYLTETNKGRTHGDLSSGLNELTEEVLRTGKAGTITLTVKIEADDTETRRLVVSETVVVKLPKATARKSVFWADSEGNLARSDPAQMSFGDLAVAPDAIIPTQPRETRQA